MGKGPWLAIGVVRRPHGVRGKISVAPLAEVPGAFLSLEEVLLGEAPHQARTYRVIRVQFMKESVVLQLEGFPLQEATRSVGAFLWVRREQLPPLGEGEYYYQDLVGMVVMGPGGEQLGVVKDVLETGDSHVLVCRGSQRELLIPFVRGIIKELDEKQGTMVVDLPEGLE
jgi:16S rRNA processing protein RimM